MQKFLFLVLLLAALLPTWIPRSDPMFQKAETNVGGSESRLSDRERNGLRGPVESVEEEVPYPGQISGEGSQSPEGTMWTRTEYDADGRLLAVHTHSTSPGGGVEGVEWVRQYFYSSAGLLLRVTSGEKGKPANEIVNHYDDQGRLQSTTDSSRTGSSVVYRYDSDGRKTRIATIQPAAHSPGLGAVGFSVDALFETPEAAPILPNGGSAVTLYDAHDRPVEVRLLDPSGALVNRAVRVYDERGNVIEERQTMEDPLKLLSATQQSDILSRSGLSTEDLRGEFAKFLGSPSELYSCRYQYDSAGRKTLTIRSMFHHTDERTETRYNDHGDVAEEITQFSEDAPGSEPDQRTHSSAVHSTYQYDSHGNWTVKQSGFRASADAQPSHSSEVRRSIEYYP